MGQVIYLTVPSGAYPQSVVLLERAERTFVQALRDCVASYRCGEDPLPHLCEVMRAAEAHDAAFSVDRLMAIIARTARRQVAIHCPRCPHLSDDEKQMLHVASLTQAGENALAERALRTALLSAPGAGFVLGPLAGVGTLFAEARLLFRRRLPPATDAPSVVTVEAWRPPHSAQPLH